jgi:hypothetical protein
MASVASIAEGVSGRRWRIADPAAAYYADLAFLAS